MTLVAADVRKLILSGSSQSLLTSAVTGFREKGLSRPRLCFGVRGGVFLPSAPRSFGHETLFQGISGHPDISDFAVGHLCLYALQVGHETPFGDGGDVRADAAQFLGFAAAPNNAALHRAFAGQFTKSSHKNRFFLSLAAHTVAAIPQKASGIFPLNPLPWGFSSCLPPSLILSSAPFYG